MVANPTSSRCFACRRSSQCSRAACPFAPAELVERREAENLDSLQRREGGTGFIHRRNGDPGGRRVCLLQVGESLFSTPDGQLRVCRQRGMRTLSLTPSRPPRAPGLRAQYGLDRTLPTHEGRSRRATVAPRANFSRPRCSLFPACSARPACSRGRRAGPQLPPRFRPIRPLAGPRGWEVGAAGPRCTWARGIRTTSGLAVHRTRGGRATRCQSRSHGPVGRRRDHSRTPAPRAPRPPSIPMSRQWCGCAPRPRAAPK